MSKGEQIILKGLLSNYYQQGGFEMKIKEEWYIIPDRKQIKYEGEKPANAPVVDVLLNDKLKDNEKLIFIILDILKKKNLGGGMIEATFEDIAGVVGRSKGWLSNGDYIDNLREEGYILNNQKGWIVPYIDFYKFLNEEGVHYLRIPKVLIDRLKDYWLKYKADKRAGKTEGEIYFKPNHLITYLLILRSQLMRIEEIKKEEGLTIEEVSKEITEGDNEKFKIKTNFSTIASYTPYSARKIGRTFKQLKELGLITEIDRHTKPKIDENKKVRFVEIVEYVCNVIPSLIEGQEDQGEIYTLPPKDKHNPAEQFKRVAN